MGDVIPFDGAKRSKRMEIDARCKEYLDAIQESYEISLRLLKSELAMKSALARSKRDVELALLSDDDEQWWPGVS